jgi:hypothetical protein
VRAVVLNPPSYSCPDDHSDLTGLVTEALSGDGLAVARFAQVTATAAITAEVTFRGLTSGQTASMTVTATYTGQVLATATVTPATDGTATRTLTVTGVPMTEAVTVLARGGTEQCRSSLDTGSAPPTLTCGTVS